MLNQQLTLNEKAYLFSPTRTVCLQNKDPIDKLYLIFKSEQI
jgi:hypothetical protein